MLPKEFIERKQYENALARERIAEQNREREETARNNADIDAFVNVLNKTTRGERVRLNNTKVITFTPPTMPAIDVSTSGYTRVFVDSEADRKRRENRDALFFIRGVAFLAMILLIAAYNLMV